MLDKLRGWSQTNTILKAVNNYNTDPNKIREDFINWNRLNTL